MLPGSEGEAGVCCHPSSEPPVLVAPSWLGGITVLIHHAHTTHAPQTHASDLLRDGMSFPCGLSRMDFDPVWLTLSHLSEVRLRGPASFPSLPYLVDTAHLFWHRSNLWKALPNSPGRKLSTHLCSSSTRRHCGISSVLSYVHSNYSFI